MIDSIRAFSELPEIYVITPRRFSDDRGWFSESWSKKHFASAGLDMPEFVQDNHSLSCSKGTVRGLHYQSPPHAQGKLVRCGQGSVFDVAVDARKGSPNYGTWVGEELSAKNGKQLWIPAGFLHGFVSLENNSEILYKCTDYYDGACDGAVRWDSIGINWPISGEVVLSVKDANAVPFCDFETPFYYVS